MRLNFKKQVKIFAMDGKTQVNKVFEKGQHDVEDIYVKTEYMDALLAKGDVFPVYMPQSLPKAKSQKAAEAKVAEAKE